MRRRIHESVSTPAAWLSSPATCLAMWRQMSLDILEASLLSRILFISLGLVIHQILHLSSFNPHLKCSNPRSSALASLVLIIRIFRQVIMITIMKKRVCS